MGAPNSSEASVALQLTLDTFHNLGVPVATHKTEGPSSCVTFLGIVVDTDAFQLRLPANKLCCLKQLVDSWQSRRAYTLKELESLLGHLSHAAMVIHPGRIFLRQLFSLLSTVSRPYHYVRLNTSARADLHWWQCFLQAWNGWSFFPPGPPAVHVYSDALGSFGYGAVSIHSG